jgi:lipoprotein-anchoring transpeptidase ErfK/SrfK
MAAGMELPAGFAEQKIMRHVIAPPFAAMGFCVLAAGLSQAGAQQLDTAHGAGQVVRGQQRYATSPQPQYAAQQSNLGGGFIEMLVNGGGRRAQPVAMEPAYQQAYQPAERTRYRPAPMPDYAPMPGYGAGQMPRGGEGDRGYRVAVAPPMEAQTPVQRAIGAEFQRQEVDYRGPHGPGTIVVDTPRRHLYLVQAGGRAIRYGIGVGRPGFEWAGVKTVTNKREWPDWTPPPEMLKRRPDLPRHMEGGPENPLGARALYLGSSLYRIHGTNEPHTIGQNVSSGCIRMMNDDVTDLYDRVKVGTRVVVM